MTRTQLERALKKVEIAIDKMIDLQDMGLGTNQVTNALETLNSLRNTWLNSLTNQK